MKGHRHPGFGSQSLEQVSADNQLLVMSGRHGPGNHGVGVAPHLQVASKRALQPAANGHQRRRIRAADKPHQLLLFLRVVSRHLDLKSGRFQAEQLRRGLRFAGAQQLPFSDPYGHDSPVQRPGRLARGLGQHHPVFVVRPVAHEGRWVRNAQRLPLGPDGFAGPADQPTHFGIGLGAQQTHLFVCPRTAHTLLAGAMRGVGVWACPGRAQCSTSFCSSLISAAERSNRR